MRAFEYGVDLDAVMTALQAKHYKQAGIERGTLIHFLKVEDRLLKVVTAPHNYDSEQTAIVTIVPLDLSD